MEVYGSESEVRLGKFLRGSLKAPREQKMRLGR